jgi:hypothetical protein
MNGSLIYKHVRMIQTKKGWYKTILKKINLTTGSPHLDDVYLAPGELDLTLCLGKQGVVLSHANIITWEELGATLPNDNSSSLGSLATIELHASELRITVSSVAGRALPFLMCHILYLE